MHGQYQGALGVMGRVVDDGNAFHAERQLIFRCGCWPRGRVRGRSVLVCPRFGGVRQS